MTTTLDAQTETENAVDQFAETLRASGATVEGRAGDVRRGTHSTGKVTRTPEQVKAESLYPIPSEAALDGEFTPAPDLERIATDLLSRHALIATDYRLIYLWKDKGGKSKGRATLGKCTKPSGLLAHFADTDFVIWLAADHLRSNAATHREVEAVVFHELQHVGETEADEEKGTEPDAAIVGHEFEGFFAELREYGTTVRDMRQIVAAAQQLTLDIKAE